VIPIQYNIRSLAVRRATLARTAIGIGLVSMIMLILFGFIDGMEHTVTSAGSSGAWIVLVRGAPGEGGFINKEQYDIIRARSELGTDSSGTPLMSPELVTGFDPAPDEALAKFFLIRGVRPIAYRVHRNLRVVAGRWPSPSSAEWAVGDKLAALYPNLTPPNEFHFGHRMWKVVGIFSDAGSARESEAFADLDVLAQDAHIQGAGYNSIHIILKPGEAASFQAALTNDSRLRVEAKTEAAYYEKVAQFAEQFRAMGLAVAVILGIGALFGGMNTMYSAVARRTREIGVLRTLGFSRGDILASFLVEGAMIGFLGAASGEIIGLVVSASLGLNSRLLHVGQLIFSFRLSPAALTAGVISGIMIGVLGALLPAWHAARLRVVDSLRAAA